MSSPLTHQTLGDAILQSVQNGIFPQDEHVASMLVPYGTLPTLLDVLQQARDETKNQICKLSRDASSDVDTWIDQARQLQGDIKRSQYTAKEIVQHADHGKEHTARVQDSASKVSLLYSEITYNKSLSQVVEQLKVIVTMLDLAQKAAMHGNIIQALQNLENVPIASKKLGIFEATRVVGVLKNKEEKLRSTIVDIVTSSWDALITVDNANFTISLKYSRGDKIGLDINVVADSLALLGLFDGAISRLSRDLDRIFISPRLAPLNNEDVPAFVIQDDIIRREGTTRSGGVKSTLEDIHRIAEYLSVRLPSRVSVLLSVKLVPLIASRLISNLLLPAVPLAVGDVQPFQETLSYVLGLAEYMDELGWSGQNQLTEWVDKSAQIWLARQKEAAIAYVQAFLSHRVNERKTVERVETQLVSKGDALHYGDDQDDEWGADWDDQEELTTRHKNTKELDHGEEEDVSAWGEDNDDIKDSSATLLREEDADGWGAEWGDEDKNSDELPSNPTVVSLESSRANPKSMPQDATIDQEVTLRETYTVTIIPDSIIESILQVITDVKSLNGSNLANSAITPASGGLYAIPSLLLAMYRATAITHYSKDTASNMLIYNDCQRLSDRLRTLLGELSAIDCATSPTHHLQPSIRLSPRLEADIKIMDGFGKRAYGREMESQRQILRDQLEDAQGFQGCTNMPFATVCDNAIATTIDRIGDVKRQWQNILSHSTLLQSLGSLVSTVLTKFINDVEEMSDIAEDESRKLHGYCVSLATLSQYFQDYDDNGETKDLVGIYTPNWFKFQYLSEILDSSLADIKYFWTDGELRLEMEADEVVSLVEALFAPSDHRRRAIAEIRQIST